MPGSVLVTGASSQLGVFLLPRLQAEGFSVLALSRRAPPSAFAVAEQVCWQNPISMPGEDTGGERTFAWPAQHLVSCGPLDIACALIARSAGLKRVVAFSSSSVLTKSDSLNQDESRQMLVIREQELRLKKLCIEREVPLVLLRPTLIYGCGLDRNISLLARFGQRFGFIPLAGKAAGLRQPVHADDLAALAVRALTIEKAHNLESVAGGGSTLAFREMAEKIAAACGTGVRVRALPPFLMALAAQLVSMLPAFRGINIEMVRRQGRDMVFDDSPLREALDYRPRPFEPSCEDFGVPEEAQKLQLPV